MNQDQAILISKLLNDRGFVIDEDIDDIPVSSYTKVASWICMNEKLLRENGYDGGPLHGWSSRFRSAGCAYGVTDLGRKIDDELIDRYCILTESIEGTSAIIEDIIKYKLAISFECSCGHTSFITPEKLTAVQKKKVITNLRGRCTKCSSASISPTGLNKPWKRT